MEYNNGDKTVESLVELLHDGAGIKSCETDLALPPRQREFVWEVTRRMLLIDSILRGIPVGGTVVVEKKTGKPSEVNDGGQRLVTLYSYINPNDEDPFLSKVKTKDGKSPSKWAKKARTYTDVAVEGPIDFVPFVDLGTEEKKKIRHAVIAVTTISSGDSAEVDLAFNRLQLGEKLNQGQKLHARTAAPWYAYLKKVEEALINFSNRSKKAMVAAHSLAIAVADDKGIKPNDVVIQKVLDKAVPEDLQTAAEKAHGVLICCAKLDDQLKDKGKYYGDLDWITRYRLLYYLIVDLDVNKNNWKDLYEVLLNSVVRSLDEPASESNLSGFLKSKLEGRFVPYFSEEVYQRMFYSASNALLRVKTVGPRDKTRRFTSAQREELFNNAEGHCEACNCLLEAGWEAHHVIYWGHKGPTTVENGQALCVPCHDEAHTLGESGVRYAKCTVDIPELVAV